MHPSGLLVDLIDPKPEHISIEDIAWSLSRTARFNGSTSGEFVYSVAQHSVWVSMVIQQFWGRDTSVALQALLHDAHEAYTGDIVTPMKRMANLHAAISEIEDRLQRTIHIALELPWPEADEALLIKQADTLASIVEAHHLVPSRGAHWEIPPSEVPIIILDTFSTPLPPMHAYEQFMEVYCDLVAGRPLELLCA
ncbi:MAG: YfbR-like 5'-deoxynucleotidase [Pseudomonadota bacterium]